MPEDSNDTHARWAAEQAQREKTQQDLFRKAGEEAQQAVASTQTRLVGWLVAGNVAGLYFVLDQASKGELDGVVSFHSIYGIFFAGAASGVVGLVADLLVRARTHQTLRNIVIAFHDLRMNPENLSSYATLVANLRKLERAASFINLFNLIAGGCLTVGLASPLWLFQPQ